MLWARQRGETFGSAIAEFSTLNKPIIATKIGCQDLAHIHLLKDKAIFSLSLDLEKKIGTLTTLQVIVNDEDVELNTRKTATFLIKD